MEVTGKDGAAVPVVNVEIRHLSAAPLSEAEWLEAVKDKYTAKAPPPIFLPYKREGY